LVSPVSKKNPGPHSRRRAHLPAHATATRRSGLASPAQDMSPNLSPRYASSLAKSNSSNGLYLRPLICQVRTPPTFKGLQFYTQTPAVAPTPQPLLLNDYIGPTCHCLIFFHFYFYFISCTPRASSISRLLLSLPLRAGSGTMRRRRPPGAQHGRGPNV